jgi:hypothetical protein
MNDTSEFMLRKQLEIIRSKPIEERIRMSFEMIEIVYDMAVYRIKKQNPGITSGELACAIFLDFYKEDFSEEEKVRICESIRKYHKE